MSGVELLILDEVGRGGHVSQRELAERVGTALGAVNRHLHRMASAGYIEVRDRQVRPFAYRLTESGQHYMRQLRHEHYDQVLGTFKAVEERIQARLRALRQTEARRVVFYGAGELMEVAYRASRLVGIEVAGVVDDDPQKQGSTTDAGVVEPPGSIDRLVPEAVVITTIRYAPEIRSRLGASVNAHVKIWEL